MTDMRRAWVEEISELKRARRNCRWWQKRREAVLTEAIDVLEWRILLADLRDS